MTIEDHVFGPLRLRDVWIGNASLSTLGGNVELQVEPGIGDAPPEDSQRRVFQEFCSALNAQLLLNMHSVLIEYRRRMPGCEDELIGLNGSGSFDSYEEETIQTLGMPVIFVPPKTAGDSCLIIQWEPLWSAEHGVQIIWSRTGQLDAMPIGDEE